MLVADGDPRVARRPRLQLRLHQVEGVGGEGADGARGDAGHHAPPDDDRTTTATTITTTIFSTIFASKEASIVEGLVDAKAKAVHGELVPEGGDEALLQRGEAFRPGHGEEGVQDVSVVDGVLASSLEFTLKLNSRLDHLQRVGEEAGAGGAHARNQALLAQGGPSDGS